MSSDPRGSGRTVSGASLSLGLGFHQIDTRDQNGIFNPAAQQSFLHNRLGWAQSFHNMPSRLNEDLRQTDDQGVIIVLGASMTGRGYFRVGSVPVRYGAEGKLKLEPLP